MDFDNPHQRAVFFDVHSDLPREGPGHRASTERALGLAKPLPEVPRVLDIGCGPGFQTLDLAELLPTARITAIDLHQPFLDVLQARAVDQGVDDRIHVHCQDMARLEVIAGSFDLLWSEGAVYNIGFTRALEAWRPLLAEGGRLAFTDAVWLKRGKRPEAVEQLWQEYPDMQSLRARRPQIVDAGYRLLADFILPEEAWWDHYYTPMEKRIETLRPKYEDDAVAQAVLDECQLEIDVYRQHSEHYGYCFFIMTPTS